MAEFVNKLKKETLVLAGQVLDPKSFLCLDRQGFSQSMRHWDPEQESSATTVDCYNDTFRNGEGAHVIHRNTRKDDISEDEASKEAAFPPMRYLSTLEIRGG